MRNTDGMRTALAFLLGCAVRAPGREVPVYREYSVPIAFYDERGEQAPLAAVAPDLAAFRSLRDGRSQEALLGKETLLPMSFQRGSSVFGTPAPLPGKLSPTSGGTDGRRAKDAKERNWLAKSLSLPTLGQASSNAALSAMAEPDGDSGWGWLASDVADAAGPNAPRPEDLLLEEEDPLAPLAPEDALEKAADPYRASRASADRKEDGGALPDAGGFPPARGAGDRPEAAVASEFAAPKSYRAAAGDVADMSQTRKIIADFSAGARPDFASLRESLVGGTAGGDGGRTGLGADRPVRVELPAAAAGRPAGLGFSGGTDAAWKGGWNLSGAGTGRGALAPELPAATVPAPAPAPTRPVFSSGGTKPAWY